MKIVPEERHLAWLLRVYTVLFAIGGFLFLLFPEIPHFFELKIAQPGIIGTLKALGGAFLNLLSSGDHWTKVVVTIPERFWVFSFFAMMLTISACCYIASLDVRKYRKLVIPVLVEKFFAAFSGLLYFLYLSKAASSNPADHLSYFPCLMVFLIDFPLFVLLLILFLRAHTGAIPEAYVAGIVDKENYKPMLVGEEETFVSIVRGQDKFAALDQVLEQAKFFDVLENCQKDSAEKKRGKERKENFKIAIKPNFMMTYNKKDCTTYTDPELVEHLIDRLHEKGYTNLTLVESQNTYGNYFKKRDVISVAEYVGYKKHREGKYRIIDLTPEREPYDYKGSFGKHFASPTWKDADFRISFAKNKTHSFCYFTLTIKNIYGTLPVQNKYLEYHKKREFDWPTIEALKHFPVHFGLIDAWWSADGQMGVIADVTPEKTMTIIGGEKLVAVDHQGAKLMNLDPTVSPFHELAVKEFGNPENRVEVKSNISKYKDWENVKSLLPELLDVAEEAPWAFSHFFMSAFIYADLEAFPLKIKGKILKWVRKSWIVKWLIDQFFATHRKRYKERHKEGFPRLYPGGDQYEKVTEC
jgi:uncharacterized protein (DUF362 family)